ncbi:hypothetical protein OESDEN_11649 [Oesophagostomum dentatum]|uniref:DNA helicase Pif1-like 2B domain-containing protein n=1 Tax=Oesophagostomum dentatum TaxID=61180 RepID=A0A0B1SUD2_OESDE|nr:hypothetical protein OESDEN_11649 [Oesophagostomum dentatum]
MILLHRKGAKGWKDLLTTEEFDGDPNPKSKFQDVAKAMDLLDSQDRWMEYFSEAKDLATPSQLRELFASAIIYGEILDVREIWERFKEDFMKDYARNMSAHIAEKLVLQDIEKQLDDSLANHEIEMPEHFEAFAEDSWNKDEEPERGNAMRATMNAGQEAIFEQEMVRVPEPCFASSDLIEEVFGEYITNNDFEALSRKVILTATNDRVQEINFKVLEKIGYQEERTYLSFDRVDSNEPNTAIEYPDEFLHSYNDSGVPPHELRLKKNCPVMLKRNLNPAGGLCNGTRLRVKELHRNLTECEFLTGERLGQRTLIPRVILTSGRNLPFTEETFLLFIGDSFP